MNQDEFIEANLDDGRLNPQHAAQLLEAALSGETGKLPDTGSAPATPAANGQVAAGTQESAAVADKSNSTEQAGKQQTQIDGTATTEQEPQDAVILARDGKHTIPFEKLAQAREEARVAREQTALAQQQAQQAMAQFAQLQEQSAQRAASGQAPTQKDNQVAVAQAAIDAGVDPELFGSFSSEDLAKGINQLMAARLQQFQASQQQVIDAALAKALAPIQQREANNAQSAHYNAVYAAHPDADSIFESKELADWVAAQPSFARAACEYVLQSGNTAEVIELFDKFKADTAPTQAAQADPQAKPVDPKAAAKAAVAAAAPAVPSSLSDIPGGKAPDGDPNAALAALSGPDMLEAMQSKGWTPKQIEDFLNRSI